MSGLAKMSVPDLFERYATAKSDHFFAEFKTRYADTKRARAQADRCMAECVTEMERRLQELASFMPFEGTS